MPNVVCAVCGDGTAPSAAYFGGLDLTEDHEDEEAAAELARRRDDVATRMTAVAGLGARIPNALWRRRTAFAAHVTAYARTLARLEARSCRLSGWPWQAVSLQVGVFDDDRVRALFANVGPLDADRQGCTTCGSRQWKGAVTDFVPHVVLPPAMRAHASASVPDWVPVDDEPQASLIAVTNRAGQVDGPGGLRNLLYATDELVRAAVARDRWDGVADSDLSVALGAQVCTTSSAIMVPSLFEID
ncbi:hypothetical protein ACIA48_11935 [Mycobacterium sp. NPDC051804]|uniref:hypothetical protein n=1 Tax=Mycobacterium sp. NPDC051804 TaxID=3364295 RepID=UPI0037A2981F